MAKLLSVLLVVALLCGVSAIGASAMMVDDEGNIVGPISLKFWENWPSAAQWALRYLAFGWLWMDLPIWVLIG